MTIDCRKVFQPVFEELDFTETKVFRDGPRFFVVGGEHKGGKVVFKADLESEKRQSTKAWFKLRREAAFLEAGNLPHIPRFYAKGTREGFFWLLEEWVPGESQEQGDSTFLIKDSFFTQRNLDYCLEFLTILHRMPRVNKSPKFVEFKEEFAKRYTLKDYIDLIASDVENLVGKELLDRVNAFIGKRHELFNSNQTVIAHHEFYAPHIFVNGGELNVIDWENVGWGNPAYDFTELWIRSFAHLDFQKELVDRFGKVQTDGEVFDQLFSLEVVFQGLGNLKHFEVPEVPEEQKVSDEIRAFLRRNIEQVLAKDGKVSS
jgi:thiamine kinase-like enzyme